MAEAQAGAITTPATDQTTTDDAADPAAPKKDAPARVYTQEEVDRIANKIRKNARYLGRKEAEAELLREGATPRQAAAAVDKDTAPKDETPKREQFDTHEEYDQARTEYTARKVAREERANAEKEAKAKTEREKNQTAEQAWHGKIQKAVDSIDDFEEVLEDNEPTLSLIQGSPMRQACVESDFGPLIIYELCKDPKEARRISALPAYKQAAEIAKIEDRLVAAAPKPEPKDPAKGEDDPAQPGGQDKADPSERNKDGTFKAKKEPSKAPDPIEPVGGGRGASASSAPSDKDDADTWRKKRTAELEARKPRK